jgi:hypothetical protein
MKHFVCTNGKWFGMQAYDVLPLNGKWWAIQNPGHLWGFQWECDGRLYRVVPRDTAETDFASIPFNGVLWRLVGPPPGYGTGRAYGPAAIAHDELYTLGKAFELQASGMWCEVWIHRHHADNAFDCAMRSRVSVEREVIEDEAPVKRTFALVDVDGWRRNIMHLAVRMGGRKAWSKHNHPLD